MSFIRFTYENCQKGLLELCVIHPKKCIGFIGLGLIGGSIAKTLRKVHPEYKLMAYCRTKATIEEAIQEGVIDIALEERDDRFADCDYIFLCAPVSTNISYLPFVKGIAKPGCIITDVGSVKGDIPAPPITCWKMLTI